MGHLNIFYKFIKYKYYIILQFMDQKNKKTVV